jgi:hypothetical protein
MLVAISETGSPVEASVRISSLVVGFGTGGNVVDGTSGVTFEVRAEIEKDIRHLGEP